MSATTQTFAAEAPQKVSRYRSLRGKSVSETRADVDTALSGRAEQGGAIVSKSPSRYRKRSKTLGLGDDAAKIAGAPPVPAVPPVPPLPLAQIRQNLPSRTASGNGARGQASPELIRHGGDVRVARHRAPVATALTVDAAVESPLGPARGNRGGRREEEEAARWAGEVARLEAETDRILAEQKRKDLARLQAQLDAAAQQTGPHVNVNVNAKPKSPVLEKFAFLTRGRRSNAATLPPTPSTCTSVEFGRANSLEPNLPSRNFIEPGGRGIVPQTDAPMSASNAAERRVSVRCKGITVNLPVSLDTTVVDVLSGCSDQMTHPINTATSMAIEVYNPLGLERRLRRYERVRDVMNSWDRDTQNSILISPDSFESDEDLDLENVPRTDTAPKGFILQLYHSHRPGKWGKRFVTLLEGGQMFSSKKPDPSPTDKDVQSLCHLSDFDIYTPTEAQMRKHLKPPKKYCYAIKSQQKPAVFLSAENFVHFFCTEDPDVAQKFHSFVHAWRSWFLVNKVLQTQTQRRKKKEIDRPPQIATAKHKPEKSISHVKVNGHKLTLSVDESPYTIGTFQPLLDLSRFDKPLDDFGKDWVPDTSRHSVQLNELPRYGAPGPIPPAQRTQTNEATFTASSLLGESYNTRMREMREQEEAPTEAATVDSPVRETPPAPTQVTPIPAGEVEKRPPEGSEAPSWFPSAAEHTARVRDEIVRPAAAPSIRPSTSAGPASQHERQRRRPPAPLVDLEPKFQEAPQWSREGRGHGVKALVGLPLVDMATTPIKPGSRFLDAPPRSMTRRDANVPAALAVRPQTSGERSRAKSVTTTTNPDRRGGGQPRVALPSTRLVARDGLVSRRESSPPAPENGKGREPGQNYPPSSARERSATVRY